MTLSNRLAMLERDRAPVLFEIEVRKIDDPQWLECLLCLSDWGVILPIEGELREWADGFVAAFRAALPDEPEPDKANGGLSDATEAEQSAIFAEILWDGYNNVPAAYCLKDHRQKMLELVSFLVEDARGPELPALPLKELPERLERCVKRVSQYEPPGDFQPLIDDMMAIYCEPAKVL
jgi:hypothetical protein